MAIQIINCPSCGTFLLDDTAECHSCGHVLNENRAAETQRHSLPTDAAVDDDMEACTNCGETCRKGLVRCWNCGAFTRPDIEAAYRLRQETNQPGSVETFDMEVLEESSVTESDSIQRRHLATPESLIAAPPVAYEEDSGGDDFELAEDVHLSEAEDDAFDLADTIQLRSDDGKPSESYEPTYRMIAPEPSAPTPTNPVDIVESNDSEIETIPLMPASASAEDDHAATQIPSLTSDAAPSEPVSSPEDELLKVAAAEEEEIAKTRKAITSRNTFVVFCPQGHRIRVREKFRGKTGKCPKCASIFVVPLKPKPNAKKKTDSEISTISGVASEVSSSLDGRYPRWLTDVRLHTVVPEKLKLKADSLLNDFQTADVGISAEDILVVTLVASAGLFGSNLKKKPSIRAAMLEHLAKSDATVDGLAVASKRQIGQDSFSQLAVVQPAPGNTESLFGNIPVFGAGRIAVRLPKSPEDKHAQYLSFNLSEFRAFASALESVCGLAGIGANTDIPLVDHYDNYKCHYSEALVVDLKNIEYYRKDPSFKLEIGGWKCAGCGLIVSEEARKKEKLGGLNGKGLAKAKCPKCTQKFGSNALVHVAATDPAPATASAPEATNV